MDEQSLALALQQLKEIGFTIDENREPPPMAPRYSVSEARELAKFEQFPSEITSIARKQPGNPHHLLVNKRYPRMLYLARVIPPGLPGAGKMACGCERPRNFGFTDKDEYERTLEEVEIFSCSCQRIVNNEQEERAARNEGWREPHEVNGYIQEMQEAVSRAAAERHYTDSKMSEKAQAEAETFNAENYGHQPVKPEEPIRRRGRKPKVQPSQPPAA